MCAVIKAKGSPMKFCVGLFFCVVVVTFLAVYYIMLKWICYNGKMGLKLQFSYIFYLPFLAIVS